MNETNNNAILPVICTRGMIVFPSQELSLDVGRAFSLKAINESVNEYNEEIIFVSQIDPLSENTHFDEVYHFGTICKVKRRIKRDNRGTIKLTVQGLKRVKIFSLNENDGCLYSEYEELEDVYGNKQEEIALVRKITEQTKNIVNKPMVAKDLMSRITSSMSASLLADTIAHNMDMDLKIKSKILAENQVNERLLLILSSLEEEKEISRLEEQINRKIKENIDENQKEYYLREKLRVIKEELGDTPNKEDDTDEIRKMVSENPYPQHIKDKI